jgi:hypothetical protein
MEDGQRTYRVIGRESDGATRSQAEEFIAKVRTDAKARAFNTAEGSQDRIIF